MWLKWFVEMLHQRHDRASRASERTEHHCWQFESLESRSLLYGASYVAWEFDRMPDHGRLDRGVRRDAPPRHAEIWDGREARGWIDLSRAAYASAPGGRLPPRGEGEGGGAPRGGRIGGFRQSVPGGLFLDGVAINTVSPRSTDEDTALNASRVLTLPPLDLRGAGNNSSVVENSVGRELAPSVAVVSGGPSNSVGLAGSTGLFEVMEDLVEEPSISAPESRGRAGDPGERSVQESTNSEVGRAPQPLSLRAPFAAGDAASRDWSGALGAWELSDWTSAVARAFEAYPGATSPLTMNTWPTPVNVMGVGNIPRGRNVHADGPDLTDSDVEGGLVELEFVRRQADEAGPASQDSAWRSQGSREGVANIVTSPAREGLEVNPRHSECQEGESRWLTFDHLAIAEQTGTVPGDEGGLIELFRTSRDDSASPVPPAGAPIATSSGPTAWIPMDHGVGLFQAVELADAGPHASPGGGPDAVDIAVDPVPDVAAIRPGERGTEGRQTEESEGSSQVATLSPWLAGLAMISYWLRRQLVRRSDRLATAEHPRSLRRSFEPV